MKIPDLRTAMFRQVLVFLVGLLWTVGSPFFFFLFLNELEFFKTFMDNYGTDIYDVKDFFYWIAVIPLWFFGFIWSAGVFDDIF